MRGIRLALAAGLVLTMAGAAASSAGAASSVGVVGSLRTVKPAAAPKTASQARISAARNEFESFQVVVAAGGAPLRGVNVALSSPLKGPGGTIPQRDVRIYREAYLNIQHPSDLEGAGAAGRTP